MRASFLFILILPIFSLSSCTFGKKIPCATDRECEDTQICSAGFCESGTPLRDAGTPRTDVADLEDVVRAPDALINDVEFASPDVYLLNDVNSSVDVSMQNDAGQEGVDVEQSEDVRRADANLPDASVSDASLPDAGMPDAASPDVSLPPPPALCGTLSSFKEDFSRFDPGFNLTGDDAYIQGGVFNVDMPAARDVYQGLSSSFYYLLEGSVASLTFLEAPNHGDTRAEFLVQSTNGGLVTFTLINRTLEASVVTNNAVRNFSEEVSLPLTVEAHFGEMLELYIDESSGRRSLIGSLPNPFEEGQLARTNIGFENNNGANSAGGHYEVDDLNVNSPEESACSFADIRQDFRGQRYSSRFISPFVLGCQTPSTTAFPFTLRCEADRFLKANTLRRFLFVENERVNFFFDHAPLSASQVRNVAFSEGGPSSPEYIFSALEDQYLLFEASSGFRSAIPKSTATAISALDFERRGLDIYVAVTDDDGRREVGAFPNIDVDKEFTLSFSASTRLAPAAISITHISD